MADKEANLRLGISATNNASEAFGAIAQSLQNLEDIVKPLAEAFTPLAQSVTNIEEVLKGLSQPAGDAASSLSRIDQSTSGMSGNMDSVAQAVQDLIQAVNGMNSPLSSAASDLQSISQDAGEARNSLEELYNISGAANEMVSALQEIQSTMDTMATNVEEQTQAVVQAIEEMAQASQTASEEIHTSTDSLGGLIGLQILGQDMKEVGDIGLHMFDGAIQSAADFEFNISRIHAVLMNREPNANMQQMSDEALKLGANSAFSANQQAEAMYELARQGLDSTQILGDGVNGAIQVTNDLAQATDSSMSDTARVVTDVMHEYNLSGDQLRGVADTISGALHSSSESLTDFYYSMRQVGPVASSMHQSAEDMSTGLALLAQHGITGSSAGTALKNMLLGLEPHTAKAAQLMSDLGISTKDGAADSFYELNGNLKPMPDILGVLNDKFGGLNDKQKEAALSATFTKYGLAGLNTIVTESKDKFEGLKKQLLDENAASIAAEKMNNLHGDMLKLSAATQTAQKAFGDTLQPALRAVTQEITKVVDWFANLSPVAKQTIMIVLGLGSAFLVAAGTIIALGTAMSFAEPGIEMLSGSLKKAGLAVEFLTGPWGLLILAIAIGVALIITHWTQINQWVQEHFGATIPQIISALGQTLSRVFKEIEKVSVQVWDAIVGAVKEAWAYISPSIMGALRDISAFWHQIWPELQEVFKSVWAYMEAILGPILALMFIGISAEMGFIKGVWENSWGFIKATLKLIWDAIIDILRIAWDLISAGVLVFLDILSGHWQKAGVDAMKAWNKIGADIVQFFKDLAQNALSWGENLVKMFAQGIESGISAAVSAAQKVVSAVKSFMGFHSPTEEGPGSDADTWAPNFVNMFAGGLSDGQDKVRKAAQSLINPLAMGVNPNMNVNASGNLNLNPVLGGIGGLQGLGGGTMPLSNTTTTNQNSRVMQFNIYVQPGKNGKETGNNIAAAIRQQMSFGF